MIKWRNDINVLEMLAGCGFTSYELRRQKIFGEATIQKLRKGGLPSWKELDFICKILAYDVGELIEFVDDRQRGEAY